MFGKSFAQNVVIYLNIVYGLFSFSVIAMGVALLIKYIATPDVRETIGWSWLFYILSGTMIAVTAILGCYAACKERKGILVSYAIFILILFGVEVVLAVFLSFYTCVIGSIMEGIIEAMFSGNKTSVHHQKECHISPFEAVTGLFSYSLCSSFNHGDCMVKEGSMYERWHTPVVILTYGIPILEILCGCSALYLVAYMSITEKRHYTAVPVKKEKMLIPAEKV